MLLTMDLDIAAMDVDIAFKGLSGNTTSANLHGKTPTPRAGTAIVAVPLPAFPTGVTSAQYSETIDLSVGNTYTPEFAAANGPTVGDVFNGLIFGLVEERMYVNINTSAFGNGEISGFLQTFPDANQDHVINTLDFNAVATHFNMLGTDLAWGDFNIDGKTNAIDFNAIAAHYGEAVNFAGAQSLAAVVPEPTLLIFVPIVAALCVRRHRGCA
jgi:hypothetical protein